jgi:carboxyl-terminal processing protease
VPYISSSTQQDREQRTYGYQLLAGRLGSSVKLGLVLPSGEAVMKTLERSVPKDVDPMPPFSWRMLPENIAYVSLTSFGSDMAADEFEKHFDELAKASSIVLDVRDNGGGSSGVGWRVLSMLTDKPFPTGRYRFRLYVPTHRAWGTELEWMDTYGDEVEPHGKKHYAKPVAVLSGPRTFSAAEDFLVAFEAMKRGKIIGEASGGSTGQPLVFSLPGGGSARVCTKQDMYPDGRTWVGKGIQPDVMVKMKADDLRAGRDTVLEAALAELKKSSVTK